MTTFVLILMILVSNSKDDSITTTSVPGFGSLRECQTAGQLAANNTPKGGTWVSGVRTTFVCAPQTPPVDPSKAPVEKGR